MPTSSAVRALARFALLGFLLTAPRAAVAAERPYDPAVATMIDGVNRGLDKFVREMSGKAKGAKVTRDGVETDISDFLEDFKTEGQRLGQRFSEGKSGDANALGFLRKAKATDGFIARHPGFTGAETEWAAMKPTMMSLAGAYGIDWEGDPASWTAKRTRDGEISAMLKELDGQVKGLGKALSAAGKSAKVDKKAMSGLTAEVKSLAASSATLNKTFSQKKPAGAAAKAFAGALAKVQGTASGLGLGADTVPALASVGDAAGRVASAIGL